MIRTLNNAIRTLLFQAHLSPSYWAEALHVATHVLNILPSSFIGNQTPHFKLFNQTPKYDHLRIFGSLCFPNIHHANTNKFSPRSTPCLFLGYPLHHRGYRCLDLKTNCIIISRHVEFDELTFPKAEKASQNFQVFDSLEKNPSPVIFFKLLKDSLFQLLSNFLSHQLIPLIKFSLSHLPFRHRE